MTIAIGGFINSSHPMAIVRQIIKRGVKDLTVVGAASGGLDLDLLIGAGCVKELVTTYMGGEHYCPVAPFFRIAVQRGELKIWECDEGMFYCALRAAAQRLPFTPWKAGIGTSFPEINPDIKVFNDPINNEPLLAIPAIKPDIAIIYAAHADPYGNVQHIGTGFGDRAMWRAADKTIVQVEKIIPNEEVRKNPLATSLHGVDAIVRAPYGSHPFAGPGYYVEDGDHIREYVGVANTYAKKGDRGPFEAYLKKYVYQPETHADYLEAIGIKRLISLYEY
ncbi:MAG: CoA transferase subunit A [Acidobacteria bacterium]|nr:CoA transferase subunit A [Acidobacteriota bacterium]